MIPSAHCKRKRNTRSECSDDPLDHDKPCVTSTIEKSDETEHEACQRTVYRVRFQVFPRSGNYVRIFRKDPREQITMEIRQITKYDTR